MNIQLKSIKYNFILNNLRQILNFLVPILVFPYVSRILGPENLGKVEFANSITSYFVLFTALGIPTYGIREIARVRDDTFLRSKTVLELTVILGITVVLGYISYFATIYFVPKLRTDYLLFLIVAPTIFLSDFSYEWFFVGIEDQTFITIRYITVKIIQIILIFVLIQNPTQYHVYAAILIGINGLSTVFNIIHLKKYVQLISIRLLRIRHHLKPILTIFASSVAISVYMHIDVTMVGSMVGDEAVGLYVVPNRVLRIVIQLITSLGVVIVPRLENVLKKGDLENYFTLLNKSLSFTLLFCIPSFLGVIVTAPEIVYIFGGESYAESILGMQLLSPILIFVPLAYFVGMQILYPHRMEGKYTISVIVASVINAIFNFFAIQKWQQNGAILGTCIAEGTGLILQVVFAWDLVKKTNLFSINTLKIIFSAIIMFIVLTCFSIFINIDKYILSLALKIGLAVFSYFLCLYVLNEETVCSLLWKIFSKKQK